MPFARRLPLLPDPAGRGYSRPVSARNARPPAPLVVSPVVGARLPASPCGCGGTLKVTKLGRRRPSAANVAVYLTSRTSGGSRSAGSLRRTSASTRTEAGLRRRRASGRCSSTGIAELALLTAAGRPERADGRLGGSPRAGQGGGAVRRPGRRQPEVAVSVFDGDDEVAPFFGFGAKTETAKVVEAMRKFRPRSRNTNLNGAVFQGLGALKEQLAQATAHEEGRLAGGVHRPRRSGPQRESRRCSSRRSRTRRSTST